MSNEITIRPGFGEATVIIGGDPHEPDRWMMLSPGDSFVVNVSLDGRVNYNTIKRDPNEPF